MKHMGRLPTRNEKSSTPRKGTVMTLLSSLTVYPLIPVQLRGEKRRAGFPGSTASELHRVSRAVVHSPHGGHRRAVPGGPDRFLIPPAEVFLAAVGISKIIHRGL